MHAAVIWIINIGTTETNNPLDHNQVHDIIFFPWHSPCSHLPGLRRHSIYHWNSCLYCICFLFTWSNSDHYYWMPLQKEIQTCCWQHPKVWDDWPHPKVWDGWPHLSVRDGWPHVKVWGGQLWSDECHTDYKQQCIWESKTITIINFGLILCSSANWNTVITSSRLESCIILHLWKWRPHE